MKGGEIMESLTINADAFLDKKPQQLSLLDAIEFSLDKVDTLKLKLKNAREMLDSELQQNEDYGASKEALKLAREENKLAKMKAMRSEAAADLQQQIDSFTQNLKDEKATLSATLVAYNEETKATEFMHGEDTYTIRKSATAKKAPKEKKRRRR
jgi:hypothetical protein